MTSTVAAAYKAIYKAIWDYDAQPKEVMESCNLCGAHIHQGLRPAEADRYGYTVWRVQCPMCGLDYLRERMTREAYARFYEIGAYRQLISAFHGQEINAQTIQPEQKDYGKRLATILAPWLGRGLLDHLDIGGSTGVVASAQNVSHSTIVDPSSEELAQAESRGHETIHGTIESLSDRRTWDVITLCQTADHLLDLMGSLKKIRSLLSGGGLFWSDIVDFDKTREVKIDHPFNLTEATYRRFLKTAGFKLLQVNYAPDGVHIGFLCRGAK